MQLVRTARHVACYAGSHEGELCKAAPTSERITGATSQLRHVIFSISNYLMLSGLETIQTAKSHLKDAYMSPVEEILTTVVYFWRYILFLLHFT